MNKKNKIWRSLEEKENTLSFQNESVQEFPRELPLGIKTPDDPSSSWSRRDFLKVMGFSTAAITLACQRIPAEKAIPFLNQPEQIVPGKSYWYASTCDMCPSGCAILFKNRDGRPIKVEGNKESPLNQGGLCAQGQAGLLGLYDSGRLRHALKDKKKVSWNALDKEVREGLLKTEEEGKKVVLLSKSLSSPTTEKIIKAYQKKFSDFEHVSYDAIPYSGLIEAHQQVFGKKIIPHYLMGRAEFVLSFQVDFLGTWLSPVEFSKEYATKRKGLEKGVPFQHIHFESSMTLTGANADQRIPIKPSEENTIIISLLSLIEKKLHGRSAFNVKAPVGELSKQLDQISEQLIRNQGKSIVLSNSNNASIQYLIAYLNKLLKNYGKTLDVQRPSNQYKGLDREFLALLEEMNSGKVGALMVYGCNPLYDFPQSKDVLNAFEKVPLRISLNSYLDETSKQMNYVAPGHHYLESWKDREVIEGLYHLSQPAISPVYQTRQAEESLLRWLGESVSYSDYLRMYWKKDVFQGRGGFEKRWKQTLHAGVFQKPTQNTKKSAKFNATMLRSKIEEVNLSASKSSDFELALFESIAIRTGMHANNPWLQEVPDPITKMAWGNAICMAPVDAKKIGVKQGDHVEISTQDVELSLPVYLQPGQATGCVSIALGFGRTDAGKVGNQVGENAFPFAANKVANRRLWKSSINLKKVPGRTDLALSQTHYDLHDRPIIQEFSLAALMKGTHENAPEGKTDKHDAHVMLWHQHENQINSWGMAIDLNACNGCSACLISCQVENNVPVVGKDEVYRRREMHWIRIDRYYKGETENPKVLFQPMLCQHCANAPCESVCPVLATVHSSDGLNQQVYNRCVGTRYCANNCPYKVRRFNWFDYANNKNFDFNLNDSLGKLVLNPDVVVRSRGVMEKCSMCIQRIQENRISSKKNGQMLNSDQIQTACQQSCPTDAIVFGDLLDPKSRLSKLLKHNPRKYRVLEELNVKPAIRYLGKVNQKV